MEASALPASVGLARPRIAIGASLLRIRSDEQLVSLFRDGNDEAFRVIHDRYRTRMLAYTRQMLAGSRQDPEDAVQEIFVRAYGGLRATTRDLALRAWLYRIAHNRCVDELRRPRPIVTEEVDASTPSAHDPFVKVQQRDALRRLIADVQRLPEQQRSALLMRELGGMAYADVSGALGVSVPAVKSLLVRARVGLAQAGEARDTACASIREDLVRAHDRGVRTSGLARRHLRDCPSCREFRSEVRGVSRQLAVLAPTLGPATAIAHLLGWGSGGTSAGAAGGSVAGAAGGGAAGAAGVAGSSAAASAGVLAGGTAHVVTLIAAAVVTAGGAVEIQRTLAPPKPHHAAHHRVLSPRRGPAPEPSRARAGSGSGTLVTDGPDTAAPSSAGADPPPPAPHPARSAPAWASSASLAAAAAAHTHRSDATRSLPLSETLDPDKLMYTPNNPSVGANTGAAQSPTGSASAPGGTPSGAGSAGSPAATRTGASAGPTGPAATAGGSSGAPAGGAAGTGSPPSVGEPTGARTSGSPGTVSATSVPAGTGAPAATSGTSATGSTTASDSTTGGGGVVNAGNGAVSTTAGIGGTATAGGFVGANPTASKSPAGSKTVSSGSATTAAAAHSVHRVRRVVMTLSH